MKGYKPSHVGMSFGGLQSVKLMIKPHHYIMKISNKHVSLKFYFTHMENLFIIYFVLCGQNIQ